METISQATGWQQWPDTKAAQILTWSYSWQDQRALENHWLKEQQDVAANQEYLPEAVRKKFPNQVSFLQSMDAQAKLAYVMKIAQDNRAVRAYVSELKGSKTPSVEGVSAMVARILGTDELLDQFFAFREELVKRQDLVLWFAWRERTPR